MPRKIIINYEISNDMEISFSPEVKELGKYGSLKKLKRMTEKYLSEVDNQFNLNGKKIMSGSLEFQIKEVK